ncbi:MAG: Coenzyme F420 hydrogenase/dehydrogenase, beta subunit C-terminal domain, partial [Fusobacteriota bacterium]
MINVNELNLDYICLGCGACETICPTNAIKIKIENNVYQPKVEKDKCIQCKKCINICPGLEINIEEQSKILFDNQNSINNDYVLGRFISNYLGYSTDEKLRYEAASGGIATSILTYLFSENIIDGAIVTKMDENDNKKSKTYIAESIEEIKEAKTSKYCPTHPLSALKDLKKYKQDKKFAFVGLPCHIHGLRKLEKREKWLKDKISLSISLFCTHSINYKGTELLLDKLAYGSENINKLQYRGNGWPGSAKIEYKNKEISINLSDYWNPYFAPYFFTPYRCLSCNDIVGELADISLGDAWLKSIEEKDDQGTSIIITRTNFSEIIIKNMEKNNLIEIKQISKNKTKKSQEKIINRKKYTVNYRINLLKKFKKPVPRYKKNFYSKKNSFLENIAGYFGALLIYLNCHVSKNKFTFKLIKILPLKILNKYS